MRNPFKEFGANTDGPFTDAFPITPSDDDPYAEGADAGLAGQPDSANPYDPETQEDAHLSWNDGWASIHYHEDDE